jgi:hypothetical protein
MARHLRLHGQPEDAARAVALELEARSLFERFGAGRELEALADVEAVR